ncbi:hypothetical protein HZH66_009334 [Vespula vulgaris]|uniref:Uncharacterized protein n=1 Tax=Vespula vulgaris TaxID=7454 RepID=A0A834JQ32_VESVU|nr:hypothetical protein HZH66_009334 [Vespula vulgaris]
MPNSVRVLLGDNGQLVELPTSGISNRVVVFENLRTMPPTTTTKRGLLFVPDIEKGRVTSNLFLVTIVQRPWTVKYHSKVSGERRSRTIEPCGIGFLDGGSVEGWRRAEGFVVLSTYRHTVDKVDLRRRDDGSKCRPRLDRVEEYKRQTVKSDASCGGMLLPLIGSRTVR